MYNLNVEYICVSSIDCSLENQKGKGERISSGTSIIFIDNNYRFKKKNGTRIYKADNLKQHVDITKMGISFYFVPFEKFKYKGVDSSILGIKRNKDYIYGGSGQDGIRLFIKRFPESIFLDITEFEFKIYFRGVTKVSKDDYEKHFKYIDYKLNELRTHLEGLPNRDSKDFTYSRLNKLFKSYVERKELLINFKDNLFLN